MDPTETKNKIETGSNGTSANGYSKKMSNRLEVLKTYKLYIDGKFLRTESGRYYKPENLNANICLASRKDFRDAVVAARKAQSTWAKKSAYNRSQIFYRIAETLEGRKAQFMESLVKEGLDEKNARQEFNLAVDRLVYYAGWSDKYQQVFSSVNPTEGSYFNFSYPEPTGIVSMIASEDDGLLGLISLISPAVIGGNTCIILASHKHPLTAIDFAEVLHASDVPAGVVNILTGFSSELHSHFSSHMDINAIIYAGLNADEIKTIQINAALNVKRVLIWNKYKLAEESSQSPYHIMEMQEIKTTWHPIGI